MHGRRRAGQSSGSCLMTFFRQSVPKRIGIALSIVLFGIPTILLWLATHQLLPALVMRGWEPLLAWFAAGSLVFVPLMIAATVGAWMALSRPTLPALLAHLRIGALSGADWRLALSVLAITVAMVALLQILSMQMWPTLSPHPPFMRVQALSANQLYVLALWLPFFFANVVGEELWWRGFIQPRQELVFGQATWIVQGILHGVFHVSFGAGVLLALLPVLFAIPWAVQRSRNTSVGIVIHAGINGPGFLAVVLGLLPA